MFKKLQALQFNYKNKKRIKRQEILQARCDEVLPRLPEEVQRFVAEEILLFDPIPGVEAAVIFDVQQNNIKYLICFNNNFFRSSLRNQRQVLVHEIAHAYLGHLKEKGVEKDLDVYQKIEKEADAFAAKYGFLENDQIKELLSFEFWQENFSFSRLFLSLLLLLLFFWMIFLDDFVFLFKWAVYM